MKYEAIIFDVGDTLLEHYPSEKQIYVDRLKSLGFEIDRRLAALKRISFRNCIKSSGVAA